mmetsp:Transcript_52672/g.132493  ORF Transcript_52672/g.132493 Transcript_52672/m.132493 type:complete len:185 (+) Transcript_52672:152-706(+)|eukprot:CAMPEP_0177660674 /NCGR_PEP_ID=MMETSP0447-20121125/18188_1 /TAXON_ID=0 /ORGANISM="Stygamoeba regulata, Strain BSH-02190019" /LENGTH=184 /DNA_ID=CAMNT_0019165799 /DNA_START=152 /DNA_END=706 /DNA_ORIENTATION=-
MSMLDAVISDLLRQKYGTVAAQREMQTTLAFFERNNIRRLSHMVALTPDFLSMHGVPLGAGLYLCALYAQHSSTRSGTLVATPLSEMIGTFEPEGSGDLFVKKAEKSSFKIPDNSRLKLFLDMIEDPQKRVYKPPTKISEEEKKKDITEADKRKDKDKGKLDEKGIQLREQQLHAAVFGAESEE